MRKADNLPPYCAVVKKSRSFNFLDPSGLPMACYGSVLLLLYNVYILLAHLICYDDKKAFTNNL